MEDHYFSLAKNIYKSKKKKKENPPLNYPGTHLALLQIFCGPGIEQITKQIGQC